MKSVGLGGALLFFLRVVIYAVTAARIDFFFFNSLWMKRRKLNCCDLTENPK